VLKIGLTGSIASGKSEAGRRLAARGARVVDADRVAHAVYQPGSDGYAPLIQAFGPGILAPDGSIDRRRLAALVFADAALRKQLTDIVWPLTAREVDRLAREQEAAGTRVFVVEAPLLVEAGWQSYFDQVWLVRARPQTLRRRLKARGLSAADIEARLAAATDAEAAAAHAHVIIDNDADLPSLQRAIDEAWNANVEG
jgi:dephospho-CoA kinase